MQGIWKRKTYTSLLMAVCASSIGICSVFLCFLGCGAQRAAEASWIALPAFPGLSAEAEFHAEQAPLLPGVKGGRGKFIVTLRNSLESTMTFREGIVFSMYRNGDDWIAVKGFSEDKQDLVIPYEGVSRLTSQQMKYAVDDSKEGRLLCIFKFNQKLYAVYSQITIVD